MFATSESALYFQSQVQEFVPTKNDDGYYPLDNGLDSNVLPSLGGLEPIPGDSPSLEGAPQNLPLLRHVPGLNPPLGSLVSKFVPVAGMGTIIVPIGPIPNGINLVLNMEGLNTHALPMDKESNNVLCSTNNVEENYSKNSFLNNSYTSNMHCYNSPNSSEYISSSVSSTHYVSSDCGYSSCIDTPSSSPYTYNTYDWIDNIINEVRQEIKREKNKRKSLKRKVSYESDSSDYSSLNGSKKYSLSGMSTSEIAKRKKEQNRIAAQRYRMKQKAAEMAESEEMSYLQKRNTFLREETIRLEKEIEEMKCMMIKFMK
uniref:BZIP domain-containing protein n=1 Tax=Parastrongyloides trichosuri TaxID=131310 RepID=A0A0N4ZRC5_PARTI